MSSPESPQKKPDSYCFASDISVDVDRVAQRTFESSQTTNSSMGNWERNPSECFISFESPEAPPTPASVKRPEENEPDEPVNNCTIFQFFNEIKKSPTKYLDRKSALPSFEPIPDPKQTHFHKIRLWRIGEPQAQLIFVNSVEETAVDDE